MNGLARQWRLRIAAVFAAAIGMAAVAGAAMVPSIAMKDLAGKSHNVNEYIGKGKWTVVAVWAHDCPICNQEIYQMEFFHDAHRKKDATVLGVSIDGANVDKAKGFVADHGLTFPNLITDPGTVSEFGAGDLIGTPTYLVFAPDGTLVGKKVGPLSQEQVEAMMAKHGAAAAEPGAREQKKHKE